MTIKMAYEMVMPYHIHMQSYFLETFTEYPSCRSEEPVGKLIKARRRPDSGLFVKQAQNEP